MKTAWLTTVSETGDLLFLSQLIYFFFACKWNAAAVPTWCAFMPMNNSETKPTRRPRTPTSPTLPVDHCNWVMQPRLSSPLAVLSRPLSRLTDYYVDITTCQIHSADCSYKLNSKHLKTEFEFQFINQHLNFWNLFNILTHLYHQSFGNGNLALFLPINMPSTWTASGVACWVYFCTGPCNCFGVVTLMWTSITSSRSSKCAHSRINLSDMQEDLMVSCIIYDHWQLFQNLWCLIVIEAGLQFNWWKHCAVYALT